MLFLKQVKYFKYNLKWCSFHTSHGGFQPKVLLNAQPYLYLNRLVQ